MLVVRRDVFLLCFCLECPLHYVNEISSFSVKPTKLFLVGIHCNKKKETTKSCAKAYINIVAKTTIGHRNPAVTTYALEPSEASTSGNINKEINFFVRRSSSTFLFSFISLINYSVQTCFC